MRAAAALIERVDPGSRTARWCVSRYYSELSERFEGGFDPGRSIAATEDQMRSPVGAFLVAAIDGEAVACGAVTSTGPEEGSIKRMWVAEAARGLGLGRRMLAALEDQAPQLQIHTLRLETNQALLEAIQPAIGELADPEEVAFTFHVTVIDAGGGVRARWEHGCNWRSVSGTYPIGKYRIRTEGIGPVLGFLR
jgi:GNAT superfamily N-acetyltransferase